LAALGYGAYKYIYRGGRMRNPIDPKYFKKENGYFIYFYYPTEDDKIGFLTYEKALDYLNKWKQTHLPTDDENEILIIKEPEGNLLYALSAKKNLNGWKEQKIEFDPLEIKILINNDNEAIMSRFTDYQSANAYIHDYITYKRPTSKKSIVKVDEFKNGKFTQTLIIFVPVNGKWIQSKSNLNENSIETKYVVHGYSGDSKLKIDAPSLEEATKIAVQWMSKHYPKTSGYLDVQNKYVVITEGNTKTAVAYYDGNSGIWKKRRF